MSDKGIRAVIDIDINGVGAKMAKDMAPVARTINELIALLGQYSNASTAAGKGFNNAQRASARAIKEHLEQLVKVGKLRGRDDSRQGLKGLNFKANYKTKDQRAPGEKAVTITNANMERDVRKVQKNVQTHLTLLQRTTEVINSGYTNAVARAKSDLAKLGGGKLSKTLQDTLTRVTEDLERTRKAHLSRATRFYERKSITSPQAHKLDKSMGYGKPDLSSAKDALGVDALQMGFAKSLRTLMTRLSDRTRVLTNELGPRMAAVGVNVKAAMDAAMANSLKQLRESKRAGLLTSETQARFLAEIKHQAKLRIEQLNQEAASFRKANADAAKAARDAARKAAEDAKRAAQEALALTRSKTSMEVMVAKKQFDIIQQLKSKQESSGIMYSKAYSRMQKELTNSFEMIADKIRRDFPNVIDDVAKFRLSIHKAMSEAMRAAKGNFEKNPMVQAGKIGFGRNMVASMAGAAGYQTIGIGKEMDNALSRSHVKGQLSSFMTDAVNSAVMASMYTLTTTLAGMAGTIMDILAEVFLEPIRMMGALLSGMVKALGALMIKGFVSALQAGLTGAMTGLMAGIAGIFTVGTSIVVGGLAVISSVVKEGLNFVTSLLSSVMSLIQDIIRTAIITVSMTVKSTFAAVKSVFKASLEGIIETIKSFADISGQLFNGLLETAKYSLGEFAKTFEYASRAYTEVVDVAGENVGKFQSLINTLRVTFGNKLGDVGEGVFDIVSSGFRSVAEATEIATASAKLALAGESDLATSVNAVITSYQNYAKQGETLATITDTLTAATTLGRMTMRELGGSLKFVIGLGARAGVSFRDLMVSLSMLTRTFGKGSIEEATRYLGRFIEAIIMPTSDARRQLEELGMVFDENFKKKGLQEGIVEIVKRLKDVDLMKLREFFPTVQSRRAWLSLTGDIEQFQGMVETAGSMTGIMEKQFQVMFQTITREGEKASASVEVLGTNLGYVLWSGVSDAAIKINKIFGEIALEMGKDGVMGRAAAAFTTWIKPALDALAIPLMRLLESIKTSMANIDFTDLFASEPMKQFRDVIKWVIESLVNLPSAIGKIYDSSMALQGVWKSIKDAVSGFFASLTSRDLLTWVNEIFAYMVALKETFGDIFSLEGMADFGKLFAELFKLTGVLISKSSQFFKQTFLAVINLLMAVFGELLRDTLSSAIDFLVNKLYTIFDELAKSGGFLASMFGGISSSIAALIPKLNGIGSGTPEKVVKATTNNPIADFMFGGGLPSRMTRDLSYRGMVKETGDSNKTMSGMSAALPALKAIFDEFVNKGVSLNTKDSSRVQYNAEQSSADGTTPLTDEGYAKMLYTLIGKIEANEKAKRSGSGAMFEFTPDDVKNFNKLLGLLKMDTDRDLGGFNFSNKDSQAKIKEALSQISSQARSSVVNDNISGYIDNAAKAAQNAFDEFSKSVIPAVKDFAAAVKNATTAVAKDYKAKFDEHLQNARMNPAIKDIYEKPKDAPITATDRKKMIEEAKRLRSKAKEYDPNTKMYDELKGEADEAMQAASKTSDKDRKRELASMANEKYAEANKYKTGDSDKAQKLRDQADKLENRATDNGVKDEEEISKLSGEEKKHAQAQKIADMGPEKAKALKKSLAAKARLALEAWDNWERLNKEGRAGTNGEDIVAQKKAAYAKAMADHDKVAGIMKDFKTKGESHGVKDPIQAAKDAAATAAAKNPENIKKNLRQTSSQAEQLLNMIAMWKRMGSDGSSKESIDKAKSEIDETAKDMGLMRKDKTVNEDDVATYKNLIDTKLKAIEAGKEVLPVDLKGMPDDLSRIKEMLRKFLEIISKKNGETNIFDPNSTPIPPAFQGP